MTQPNTTTEMVAAIAEALIRRDDERLYDLHHINEGWMQTPDEHAAMARLIAAAIEAAEELHETPSQIGPTAAFDRDTDPRCEACDGPATRHLGQMHLCSACYAETA